jgi:hypothetical protein
MDTQEKRKHARFNSLNLSYVCLDENNQVIKQGMGRTLNVSESGITEPDPKASQSLKKFVDAFRGQSEKDE